MDRAVLSFGTCDVSHIALEVPGWWLEFISPTNSLARPSHHDGLEG